MGLPDLFLVKGIFPGPNVRVTAALPNEQRAESSIAVDPAHPHRLLGVSKRFYDPTTYKFSLGPVFSNDGGDTWQDLPAFPLQPNHDIYTDPSAVFDTSGAAWVMGDPGFHKDAQPQLFESLQCANHNEKDDIQTTQMLAFKSVNSGASWSAPVPIVPVRCRGDDKGWLACDNSLPYIFKPSKKGSWSSPYHGRLYAIWGAARPLRFARSLDGGQNWIGMGAMSAGDAITKGSSFGPDISISRDGTIHIFWLNSGTNVIQYLRSTDGGETFVGDGTTEDGFPKPRPIVTGLRDLTTGAVLGGNIHQLEGWPVFDGATFRVLSIVAACCFGDQGVAVSWADTTSGYSRTYYRVSHDNGVTWEGPDAGTPMLPIVGDSHQFHPQLAATGTGVLGCAMYSFSRNALPQNKGGISVLMAASFDNAASWSFVPVTDHPWDPAINAPISHGKKTLLFIGDYFGFDAGKNEFHILWTDTRNNNQDLFYCQVATEHRRRPEDFLDEIVATFLSPGVSHDGGGFVIVGGHIIRIPPRDPLLEVLDVAVAIESVSRVGRANTTRAKEALYDVLANVAKQAKSELKGGHQT